jgi:uncharacterized YigZ family protein
LVTQTERHVLIVDSYKTIRAATVFEMKVKGSRFICHAQPVASRDAAENLVAARSRQYYDATHNCFAYRLFLGQDEISRFSDDGEPSGTAGKPILQAIVGQNVTNIAVVVTRYFGGVKLGTGGLIRAYGGVTLQTLQRAAFKTVYMTHDVQLTSSYHHLNTVMAAIEKFSGKMIQSDYAESIQLKIQLRQSYSQDFIQYVIDCTSGQVEPSRVS